MKKQILNIVPLMLLLIAAGCGADKEKRERIAQERQNWVESLADSVTVVRAMQDSVKTRLDELHDKTELLLARFRCVDNPKEVERYYLPDVHGAAYPLTRPGLTARLTASETLELIAVNIGQTFDQLGVKGGDEEVRSVVVPYDQALNYRNGTMTTVAFSGSAADSIARLVTSSTASDVTLLFLHNGSPVGEIPLNAVDRECVSLSWRLASARQESMLSERRLTQLARRLAVIESKRDELKAR